MVKFVESDSTGLPLKRKQVAQACLSCRRRKVCPYFFVLSFLFIRTPAITTCGIAVLLTASRGQKRCIHEGNPEGAASQDLASPTSSSSQQHQHQQHVPPLTIGPARTRSDGGDRAESEAESASVVAAAPTAAASVSVPPLTSHAHAGGSVPAESPRSQESQGRASRFVGDLNPEHLLIEATSPHSARDLSVRGGIGVWQSRPSQSHQDAARPPYAQFPRPTSHALPSLSSLPWVPSGPGKTLQDIVVSYVRTHYLPCVPTPGDWVVLRKIYFDKLHPLFPALSPGLAALGDESTTGVLVKQVICIAVAADPDATPHLRLRPNGNLLGRHEFRAILSAAVQATLDSGLLTDRVLMIRLMLVFSMYMQPNSPDDADLPTLVSAKAVNQTLTLGLQLPVNDSDDDYDQLQSLFLCVWALDRLNAAFYGRATLLHERDIGWNIDTCIARQPPASQFFLMVVRLLDNVISLYRPSQRAVEEPMYIDLPISEQMIIDAGATKVPSALLATVEVLYHSVAILSCRFPPGGSHSALPSRATNSRRSHSADRIVSLIRDEFDGQLSYMPILPYAVSLSLSVGYRKMRYSNVPMFRHRGRRSFIENTALLKGFADIFWTAKTMAAMAEQVLQEMDKAMVLVAQETQTWTGPGVSNATAFSTGAAGVGESSGSQQPHATTAVMTEQPQSSMQGQGNVRHGNWAFDSPGTGTTGTSTVTGTSGLDGTAMFETAAGVDVDVFGRIDPSFNLDAVDAALEANLDFGTSSNWFDWQQTWAFTDDGLRQPLH